MNKLQTFTRKYAFPLWGWYVGGLVALAVTNIVMLKIPQLAKTVINALAQQQPVGDLTTISLLIIGLGVLLIFVRTLSRMLLFWPGRSLETTARQDVFAHVLKLPQVTLSRFGMGDLISRLANDVGHLRAFFAFGCLQIANLIFLTIFSVAQMATTHAMLTIYVLLPLAFMLVISRLIMPRLHQFTKENQEAVGKLTNRVTEAFANVHTVQASAAIEPFVERIETENHQVFITNMRTIAIRTLVFPLMSCLSGISQLIVLFYGGHEVMAGHLTIGDIMAFNIYIGMLSFPLTAVGIILAIYQRAKSAAERMAAITDEKEEGPASSGNDMKLPPSAPLLKVSNLSFAYPETPTHWVLQNLNMEIHAGQHVGLKGVIGAGKTTLFQLITRIYDPPAGTIFWRGKDILHLPVEHLRAEIGLVTQAVYLFSDTIAANLTLGLTGKNISLERLEEVARDACILEDIHNFPQGWQTEIGEKGIRLSGGQRQRLSLARTLLHEPTLILLDDVLSAVDHRTESRLIATFQKLKQTALFLSSHRPSVFRTCSQIIELQDPKRQGSTI